MKNYWIVKGDLRNWRLALAAKGIWGLKDQPLAKVYWLAIAPGDTIFFYVTGKVKGVVGYGTVRAKFHQTTPLFADEIKAERVLWPSGSSLTSTTFCRTPSGMRRAFACPAEGSSGSP